MKEVKKIKNVKIVIVNDNFLVFNILNKIWMTEILEKKYIIY
jgi:hypothetical protein